MRTKNLLYGLASMLLILLCTMTGCDIVHDDNVCDIEPTSYQVKFRYDMNLKFADAFAHEVDAVTLLVLDDNYNIVKRYSETNAELLNEDYTMTVEVNPGTYKLLAWCTTNENNSFNVDVSGRSVDNYSCTLIPTAAMMTANSEQGVEVSHELDDLYHGLVTDATFPNEPGTHIVTVPLTKDTNRFTIVLSHVSGEPIDVDDFDFKIEADNQVLRYDNTVEPNNPVIYRPHYTESAYAQMGVQATYAADYDDGSVIVNAAVAELTVNRLVVEDNPSLTVTKRATGEVVFRVPVKDYVLLTRSKYRQDMDEQEYLDRQDEYNMTFFLDDNDRWLDAYIYINSWRVVLNRGTAN
jgi:hypothetical protein